LTKTLSVETNFTALCCFRDQRIRPTTRHDALPDLLHPIGPAKGSSLFSEMATAFPTASKAQ